MTLPTIPAIQSEYLATCAKIAESLLAVEAQKRAVEELKLKKLQLETQYTLLIAQEASLPKESVNEKSE